MTQWRKSSRSGGVSDQACVEVAQLSALCSVPASVRNSGPGRHAVLDTGTAQPPVCEER
jgi:hypothetical protein